MAGTMTRHSATGAPVAPMARSLLAQARRMLVDAEWATKPTERFSGAYAAALRASAAVLVARGRPHRGRAKPTSSWVLLEVAVPELGEWARFFAAHSGMHEAVQAGISGRIGQRTADDLLRQAAQFVELAARAVYSEPAAAPRRPRVRRSAAVGSTGHSAQREGTAAIGRGAEGRQQDQSKRGHGTSPVRRGAADRQAEQSEQRPGASGFRRGAAEQPSPLPYETLGFRHGAADQPEQQYGTSTDERGAARSTDRFGQSDETPTVRGGAAEQPAPVSIPAQRGLWSA